MSNAVHVTGIPQLKLTIGDQTVLSDYVSGTGTNKLVFHYTIMHGENDADGISIAANSLTLNGGYILAILSEK